MNTNNTARCTIGHFGVRRVTVTDISPSSEWLANIGQVLNSALPAVDDIVLEDVTFLDLRRRKKTSFDHLFEAGDRAEPALHRTVPVAELRRPRSVKLDGVTVELTSPTTRPS